MNEASWNTLLKRATKLKGDKSIALCLFCAEILEPFFRDFCIANKLEGVNIFEDLLRKGWNKKVPENAQSEVMQITPDVDMFEDTSVSYANYAALALNTALTDPSPLDSVNYVWAVYELLVYNEEYYDKEELPRKLAYALSEIESGHTSISML